MDNDQQVRWSFISVVRWPPGVGPSAKRTSQGPLPMTPIGSIAPTRRMSDARATRQSPAVTLTVDRSAKNIESWSAYLPADCVAVMVSLGWDRTA
jgi:hypothetical protein